MLLRAFQFPVAIGQRFIVQLDLAHLLAQPAHPHAERCQRQTRNRKQKARTEREGVRIIGLGPASGDESISAAERGGKDRHRADGDIYPGMAAGKTAEARSDAQGSQHEGPLRGWIIRQEGLVEGCVGDVSKCLKRESLAVGDSNMANEALTPHMTRSATRTRAPAPTTRAAASLVLKTRDCTKTR